MAATQVFASSIAEVAGLRTKIEQWSAVTEDARLKRTIALSNSFAVLEDDDSEEEDSEEEESADDMPRAANPQLAKAQETVRTLTAKLREIEELKAAEPQLRKEVAGFSTKINQWSAVTEDARLKRTIALSNSFAVLEDGDSEEEDSSEKEESADDMPRAANPQLAKALETRRALTAKLREIEELKAAEPQLRKEVAGLSTKIAQWSAVTEEPKPKEQKPVRAPVPTPAFAPTPAPSPTPAKPGPKNAEEEPKPTEQKPVRVAAPTPALAPAPAPSPTPSTAEEEPAVPAPTMKALKRKLRRRFKGLQFEATVITPPGCRTNWAPAKGLPVVFHITGMGWTGCLKEHDLDALAAVAPEPFVLASPWRKESLWWLLDDASSYGWVKGNLVRPEVRAIARWMRWLVRLNGVDSDRVSVISFSAGAYALSEIMCCPDAPCFLNCCFGGIHGHAQPDMVNIEGAYLDKAGILRKWDSYIERIKERMRPAANMVGIHHEQDRSSPWRHAKPIFQSMNVARHREGMGAMQVFLLTTPGSSRGSNHGYHDQAFMPAKFWSSLLLGEGFDGTYDDCAKVGELSGNQVVDDRVVDMKLAVPKGSSAAAVPGLKEADKMAQDALTSMGTKPDRGACIAAGEECVRVFDHSMSRSSLLYEERFRMTQTDRGTIDKEGSSQSWVLHVRWFKSVCAS